MSSNTKSIRLAVGGLVIALTIGATIAQQPADLKNWFPFSNTSNPQDPNAFKISSHSEMVLLDVSVKDPAGGFVSGLTKENFQVMDNAKPQNISSFEAGDIPVTLGLVVDNSGSMRSKRSEVVTAALAFAQASNPKDEIFVVNFNDRVSLGLPPNIPFTDDRQLLRTGLLTNPVQGRTSMNDALKLAFSHLEKGRQQKKALVLISDGGDNASETTEAQMFRLAEESRATVYTVGIYDSDDRDRNPGVLRKLANLTGGEVYLPERLSDMVGVCQKIAKDIRNRYAIGFIPADIQYDGSVRKVKVIASASDRGKLLVKTRTHYIASQRGQTTVAAKSKKK